MAMYVGFFKRLDMRTDTARNLLQICNEFSLSLDIISPLRVKEAGYSQFPDD